MRLEWRDPGRARLIHAASKQLELNDDRRKTHPGHSQGARAQDTANLGLVIMKYYRSYVQLLEMAGISPRRAGRIEAGARAMVGAMTRGRIAARPVGRVVVAACMVLPFGMILSGCTSSSIGDSLPTAVGGLPEAAPKRPATPAAYPAVHEMPPPRASAVLTEEEQQKLENDLAAARQRAAAAAGKPKTAGTADKAKTAGTADKPKAAGATEKP